MVKAPAETQYLLSKLFFVKLTSQNNARPACESMVTLEHAVGFPSNSVTVCFKMNECFGLLVMRIAHPGERADGTNEYDEICGRPGDKHGVMVDVVQSEVVHDLEREPTKT